MVHCNPKMTNLCTDKIVYFYNLTKIGTDENKAIYSMYKEINRHTEVKPVSQLACICSSIHGVIFKF